MNTKLLLLSMLLVSVLVLVRLMCEGDYEEGGFGNILSAYFYLMYVCSSQNRSFYWKSKSSNQIIEHLPRTIQNERFTYRSINNKLSAKLLHMQKIKHYNTYCSSWETMSSDVWKPLVPHIQQILQQISYDINFVNTSNNMYDIVIHYRLGDILFKRLPSYELLYHNWFLQAINSISPGKRNKILVITNYTWKNNDTNLSKLYMNEFEKFLSNNNNDVSVRYDGDLVDDFYTMLHAPALISSGSSLSFFAGMGANSRQLFVFPTRPQKSTYDYRVNMIPKPGVFLKHSEVPDYYDLTIPSSILNNRISNS